MAATTAPVPDHPGKWVIPQFGPPSVLRWETLPDDLPKPGKDTALIRIIVAGIAGPDNIQRAGGYPHPICKQPGFTPGYDFVGEILELGPSSQGGTHFAVGDRVASMCTIGAHATHITLPVSDLLRVGKDDDVVKACALPLNYMTAWGMLMRSDAQLPPESSVLIGSVSGGVGTAMAQLIRAFDLNIQMFGTCSPSKFEYVRSLGVTPIDRNDPSFGSTVRGLTGGKQGVDVAYDAVGSQHSLNQSLQATKDNTGQVICFGIMGEISADGSGMNSNADLDGKPTARLRERMSFWHVVWEYYSKTRELFGQDFENLLEKVRNGRLDPKIARLFPLREAVRANEMLVSGAGVTGKMEYIVDAKLAAGLGL